MQNHQLPSIEQAQSLGKIKLKSLLTQLNIVLPLNDQKKNFYLNLYSDTLNVILITLHYIFIVNRGYLIIKRI